MDVKRLAAAQAHARHRQQSRALDKMYQQVAHEQNLAADQYMRDRRKRRLATGLQASLGGLMSIGGAVAGIPGIGGSLGAAMAPGLIGGGLASLGGAAASGTGEHSLAGLGAMLGQTAASGMMNYQNNQAMQAIAAQLAAAQQPAPGPAPFIGTGTSAQLARNMTDPRYPGSLTTPMYRGY